MNLSTLQPPADPGAEGAVGELEWPRPAAPNWLDDAGTSRGGDGGPPRRRAAV